MGESQQTRRPCLLRWSKAPWGYAKCTCSFVRLQPPEEGSSSEGSLMPSSGTAAAAQGNSRHLQSYGAGIRAPISVTTPSFRRQGSGWIPSRSPEKAPGVDGPWFWDPWTHRARKMHSSCGYQCGFLVTITTEVCSSSTSPGSPLQTVASGALPAMKYIIIISLLQLSSIIPAALRFSSYTKETWPKVPFHLQ